MKARTFWSNGGLLLVLLLTSLGQPTWSRWETPAAQPVAAATLPAPDALAATPVQALLLDSAPLMFIENVGQFPDEARFQVHGGDRTIWLVEDALWVG